MPLDQDFSPGAQRPGGERLTHSNDCIRKDHPLLVTLLSVDPLACLVAPADRYLTEHEQL